MKILGGYNQEASVGRRASKQSRAGRSAGPDFATRSNSFRIGRTMAGDARKTLEAKRRRANDQRKRKVRFVAVISASFLVVLTLLFATIHITMKQKAERELAAIEAQQSVKVPTVPIIDENAGENISQRVKDFVFDLEGDLAVYNLGIDHVSLPLQKAREIRVFLIGRGEYFKMSLDRGSAVQAEDLQRMVKYLDERDLHPEYVDLRVSGKAYYK